MSLRDSDSVRRTESRIDHYKLNSLYQTRHEQVHQSGTVLVLAMPDHLAGRSKGGRAFEQRTEGSFQNSYSDTHSSKNSNLQAPVGGGAMKPRLPHRLNRAAHEIIMACLPAQASLRGIESMARCQQAAARRSLTTSDSAALWVTAAAVSQGLRPPSRPVVEEDVHPTRKCSRILQRGPCSRGLDLDQDRCEGESKSKRPILEWPWPG